MRRIYFLGLGILLLCLFLFHLRYLSRFFDWDSIVYTLNIQKNRVESAFFNPHHLGFESSGLLYWKWVKTQFPSADIMFSLRLRILASSLIFLFVFVWLFVKLYNDFWMGVLLALAIQFSQAFWFYSLHNDTPLIHSCLVAILYLSTVLVSKMRISTLALIGLWFLQLFTIYFHQSNIIHFGIVPMGILLSKERELGNKLRIICLYLVSLGIAVIASYLFVGFIILKRKLGPPDETHFTFWMFLYAAINRWGTSVGEKNYIQFFYRGIGDAFLVFQTVVPSFRVNFNTVWSKANTPYNLNLILWISLVSLFLLNIRNVLSKFKNELLILVFWFFPTLLFYTWWEGYFFEFWVGGSIALWIFSYFTLAAFSLSAFPRFSESLRHVFYLSLVFCFFITNFTYSTLPRSIGPKFGYTEGIQGNVFSLADEKIYLK